jgi:Predicted nucleotidyltransferase
MRAVGIVIEYNPMHNGHAYHVLRSREVTGADVVVAVMSGNFLQRGEPALTNKWSRTEMALRQGVDVVLELPVVYATQNAELFAWGPWPAWKPWAGLTPSASAARAGPSIGCWS